MRFRNLFLFIPALAVTLAAQPRPPVPLPEWVKAETNISYDKYPETVLDVFVPTTAHQGKRPGILLIHGGGWTGGTKDGTAGRFGLPYLEKGFVVVNVEYRLAKAALAPAAVEDVLAAAKWFRNNAKKYNVDKNRIAVTGFSAGGHLALMVGMTPKSAKLGPPAKVKAVVNFYGITDVGDQLEGPNMRSYATTWIPEQKDRFRLAKRVSPMTYVRKDLPPILTIHGDADQTVPYEHGVKLTQALRSEGAKAEMMSIPQGRHGFTDAQLAEIHPRIFVFLKEVGVL